MKLENLPLFSIGYSESLKSHVSVSQSYGTSPEKMFNFQRFDYDDYNEKYNILEKTAQDLNDWEIIDDGKKLMDLFQQILALKNEKENWKYIKQQYDNLRMKFYSTVSKLIPKYFSEYKISNSYCGALSCGHIMFNDRGIEKHYKEVRLNIEYEKFKNGNINDVRLWDESFKISNGSCIICEKTKEVNFSFDPTSGEYGPYLFCSDCIEILNNNLKNHIHTKNKS